MHTEYIHTTILAALCRTPASVEVDYNMRVALLNGCFGLGHFPFHLVPPKTVACRV